MLYHRTNTNAIQFWKVEVGSVKGKDWGVVRTTFGQLGTDKPQTTDDIIKEGKNIGKTNETTPKEQAKIKAQQMWDKQVKKGYVTDLDQAKEGKNELGGIKPMLAQVYADRKDEIKFPCFVQPKLDGMRCIAVCTDGKVSLFSRTQKPINTVPHIVEQLEFLSRFHETPDFITDGEMYSHEYKEDFNKIMSILKRDEVHKDANKIEYHIYDIPSSNETTSKRMVELNVLLDADHIRKYCPNLKKVETFAIRTYEHVDSALGGFLEDGYEGAMIRTEGPYEFKRSKHLLKYKEFQDDEFKIVGVEEGKGKLMGHAGAFLCEMDNGKRFKAKMKGELKNLKEMFDNFEKKYLGKMMTIKFFRYTTEKDDGEGGVPYLPVGMRIRVEE